MAITPAAGSTNRRLTAGRFLTAIFSPDMQARSDAESRLGLNAQSPAPSELYGLPARVSTLAASSDRLTLLIPADAGDPFFKGGLFSGRVPMTTVRLPLKDFGGVNLGDIRELALVFDRTPSGSLFIGDVELVRSQP